MRRCLAGLGCLVVALSVTTAGAVDLTGKWRFVAPGIPGAIVQVTQSGSALSFTFGFSFAGSVTSAGGAFSSYSVMSSPAPGGQAGIGGRVMPSGNLLDGRAVSFFPPDQFFVSSIVATRCTCHDGNIMDGDGCDSACGIEPCWTCSGDPSVCQPAAEGSACEDDSPCTTGEFCTAGVCGGGAPVTPCTDMTGLWNVHRDVPGLGQSIDFSATFVQRGTDLFAGGTVGTIDPATGVFDVRSVNPNLFCPSFDPLDGVVGPSGTTYTATGLVWEPIPSTPDHCEAFVVSECGNTTGEPIPACIVTTTTFTTTTTTTTSSTISTTTTTTSTTTSTTQAPCAAAPLPGCRVPVESGKARLQLKDKASDTADTVKWTWKKGAATPLGEFGDPLNTTDYVACLYDGGAALLMTLRVPGGGLCGDAQCWKRKGETSFRYSDRSAASDGVKKLMLRSGPAGKAAITLLAKGAAIPMPTLGALSLPLRMQLQGDGRCWEAVYSTAQTSSPAEWKGRAD